MSNYHTYECDRCGRKELVVEFPKYWASLRVNDTNRSYSPLTDKDLCNNCIGFVYEAVERRGAMTANKLSPIPASEEKGSPSNKGISGEILRAEPKN